MEPDNRPAESDAILSSAEMEDERWSAGAQLRDWLKLLVMILITLAWCLTVFYLEPGLR